LFLNTANIGISREMAKYFYAVFQRIFRCFVGASTIGLTAASPLAREGHPVLPREGQYNRGIIARRFGAWGKLHFAPMGRTGSPLSSPYFTHTRRFSTPFLHAASPSPPPA
jgi:hypothetical protein